MPDLAALAAMLLNAQAVHHAAKLLHEKAARHGAKPVVRHPEARPRKADEEVAATITRQSRMQCMRSLAEEMYTRLILRPATTLYLRSMCCRQTPRLQAQSS